MVWVYLGGQKLRLVVICGGGVGWLDSTMDGSYGAQSRRRSRKVGIIGGKEWQKVDHQLGGKGGRGSSSHHTGSG